ncbi:AsmA family protein [Nitratireductor aquimarinus]|uniref:AsmA family protein n=1 Tax=Nitratireductor aquimarinus TaxID=889300 RepID=UPI001A8C6CD8|nr:AsmA family protein [Nitratireductor aquimarinus]MBN8242886.1 AsmA family protein [Nitratireductor aquimarinus]MBY6131986.1 AsmA family protein [Nitratireductor aquimarinus]MCA1301522.1 AsmA family protein [Nitratireductor aquimarinus]
MFVFFGGLVVLALTSALVAPYFIDWNHYRSAFEREAGRVLGREVRVEGSARARLLPFPSLTFTDVVVAGKTPQAPGMTVDEFSMHAELAPFLRGEVLIFDMQLTRPHAQIAIAADGGIDWAVRPSGPFDARQVTLENVSIVDGSVTLAHAASGRQHELTDIDAQLSARSLAGPWRIGGTLSLDDMPMRVSVSTGSLGDDGRMRVRFEALPDDLPVRLATDGQARIEEGAAFYDGAFALNTYSDEAMARLRKEAERPLALTSAAATNRLTGLFDLRHDRLAVEQFRFETGPADAPYTAEGRASLELGGEPRFFISADGAQLRFDGENDGDSASGGLDIARRFEAFAALIRAVPSPTIPGEVAINLPAIVAGDTTIRNIELRAEPAEGGWAVGSVAATLPGRTRFEANGFLAADEELGFNGHMLLAIAQPSGFAAWVSRDVDDAIRRLPAAGFSADVALSRRAQTFEGLELILGDARFNGRVERREPENAKPWLDATLDGEALDLEGIQAFMSLFVSDAGVNRLSGHDVDLDIKAGPVAALGMQANTLDTALRLREGVLEIDRLTLGGFAGAQLSATGQLRNFAGMPTGQVDATVLSTDLGELVLALAGRFPENRVFRALAQRVQAFPGLLQDAELNLVASAAENGDETMGIAVSAEGVAGGTDLSLSLSDSGAEDDLARGDFKLSLTARNDEAAVLYGLAGIPALPLGLVGEARLELSAEGSLADTVDGQARVMGEGLVASFKGQALNALSAPSLDGEVRLVSDDIETWLAVGGVVLPGFGLGMPVALSADLEWSEKLAVLTDLEGEVAGSGVTGDLNIALDGGKPHIDGALTMTRFDLAPAAELVMGPDVLSGEEDGAWPQAPFGNDVSLPFSANLDLRTDALWTGFLSAGRDARLKLRLDDEGLTVSDLKASLFDGSVEGFATLKNNAGTGLLSAQIGLNDTALDTLMPQGSLEGRMSARASVTASGKSVNAMAAALTGSGSATLKDLVINGLNPKALPQILEEADAVGNGIDLEKTEAFAPRLIREGQFSAGETEFAFTIAGGMARTPPVQLATDGATFSTTATADLQKMEVSTDGALVFDPGVDAVVGAEPRVEVVASGPFGFVGSRLSVEPLAQYLTQRALEREQVRVERMQSVLLEKQRLRREARYFAELEVKREQAEAERQRLERELRLEREEAERRAAEEAERKAREAEEARRREAEEAARLEAEEARRREAEAARAAEALKRTQRVAPAPSGNGSASEIERAPLEPPSGGINTPDAVSEFFRAKDLSADRLRELLDGGQ